MQKKTVVGLDLRNYRGIDPYRDVGRTYRSTSEAFKDATYACAIHRHTSDFAQGVRWFSDFCVSLFLGGCAIALPIFIVLWLTK